MRSFALVVYGSICLSLSPLAATIQLQQIALNNDFSYKHIWGMVKAWEYYYLYWISINNPMQGSLNTCRLIKRKQTYSGIFSENDNAFFVDIIEWAYQTSYTETTSLARTRVCVYFCVDASEHIFISFFGLWRFHFDVIQARGNLYILK